jgi:hypothetical protein
VSSSHGEIATIGKEHFSNLFKDSLGCLIVEMLIVIKLFLESVNDEMNDYLQEEISEK